MLEMARKTVLFGIGALSFTKEKAEKLVKELTEKGKLTQGEAVALVNDILIKGAEEKAELANILQVEIESIKDNLGLITKEDLASLEKRIQNLEDKVEVILNNRG